MWSAVFLQVVRDEPVRNMTGRLSNRLGVGIGQESWHCLFPGFGQQCRLFRRGIQREGLRRMDGLRIAVAG